MRRSPAAITRPPCAAESPRHRREIVGVGETRRCVDELFGAYVVSADVDDLALTLRQEILASEQLADATQCQDKKHELGISILRLGHIVVVNVR